MKILFISPKPFGLMGTPGTYLLVEAYAQKADVCVISNKDNRDPFRIVHPPSDRLRIIEVSFSRDDCLASISRILESYEPDIVNVVSHPGWTAIVDYLKAHHPAPKYVFDIKSPLLSPGKPRRSARIKARGQHSVKNIDLILTRCREDVSTLIPDCTKPICVYPLGVDLAEYSPRDPANGFSICNRFVYVGAIAALRKLEILLQYIADLPQSIKETATFDFFGSGPAEEDFKRTIRRLRLENTVAFKGCADTGSLPALLRNYDSGIAWVPHDLYDTSPSLKIVEYTAAGLLPLATDTTAHKRFAEGGFHVSFFSESADSFSSAIAECCSKGYMQSKRSENLTVIKDYDWARIAEKYIFPSFYKLLGQHEFGTGEIGINFDRPDSDTGTLIPTSQNSTIPAAFDETKASPVYNKPNGLSRILVISPRPFGLLGTAGTYLLFESYSKIVETRIVARKPDANNANIIYQPESYQNITELEFGQPEFLPKLHDLVNRFQPQVVIIFNYVRWFSIVNYLKQNFPKLKCVLDVQTPLLIENDKSSYKKFQKKGKQSAHLLDLILALSEDAIPTWIPGWTGKSIRYSLGIKISSFHPPEIPDKIIYCRRFVFIGALHKLRKLDILIGYIASLPIELRREVKFDFYGDGPARDELELLVEKHNLKGAVEFKGVVESEKLALRLSKYDAGIAWVPHEVYNSNPSLKLLEYMAAGIVPLAMDTAAHKRDAERGFHIEFFSDSSAAFTEAIQKVFDVGFPVSLRNENLKRISRHDYDVIADREILPALSRLVSGDQGAAQSLLVDDKSSAGNISDPSPSGTSSKKPPVIYQDARLWKLPLYPPKPERLSRSKIRVAGILGEQLFKSIALECDLLMLNPANWNSVLSYAKPDLLLVESAWSTVGGHWYMAQSVEGEGCSELIHIIDTARKLGVPTIFWMTLDSAFHEYFSHFARHFDLIFCADPRETELMHKDKVASSTLLPAVQPVLFNPVQNAAAAETFKAGVLFDGWIDLVRIPEIGNILKRLEPNSLNIYQSFQFMYNKHLQSIDSALLPCVRGSVDTYMLPALLKHASVYTSMEKSTVSRTQKVWSAFEAAACRLPIAHLGGIETDDPRNSIVQQFDNETSFCEYVRDVDNLRLNLEQNRHNAWRQIYLNHTIAHRLDSICRQAGVDNDRVEFPRVSLIAVITNLMDHHKFLKVYETQTYPNKELLLLLHGDPSDVKSYCREYAGRSDVKVYAVPPDCTLSTALNYGLQIAAGEYFFRIDGDHDYGSNYVQDSMLYLRAVKADLLGKGEAAPPGFNSVSNPVVRLFLMQNFRSGWKSRILDGSLGGSVKFMRSNKYPDRAHLPGDNLYLDALKGQSPESSCLITDQFEFDFNAEKYETRRTRRARFKKPPAKKILYIGPWQFASNVGKKNVRVIYPTLFDPLHDCELHILHGKPKLPRYTRELVEKYGVVFHRVNSRKQKVWIKEAISLSRELDIDVLTNVFFGYRYGYIAARAARKTGRKSVVRFAANEIYVRKCNGSYRGLQGKILYIKDRSKESDAIRKANEVIAMSPWEVKRIKKRGSFAEKIKWCMRGIDVAEYAPPHERAPGAARNYLFVGRKQKEKGYPLIEAVAKKLLFSHPDIRFYFAGNFEPCQIDNRTYLGYCSHERLKKLYSELDALILPSESEGFANVIVEAMTMGMPCIISRSFHQEYFKHRQDAMLTDLTTVDLEQSIIELYNDIELYTCLSENARTLAVKEFDSKKWADQYRKIIIGQK